MRHRKDTFKLGRTGPQRKSMLANQVSSLILSGEIRTTVVKAKASKRLAEKIVTLAKKGDLHHRRLAISLIRNNDAVKKVFAEIAPKFTERKGGYTRIMRLGNRRGDAAEICILRWVEEELSPKKPAKKKTAKKNKSEKTEKTEEQAVTAEKETPSENPGGENK